ncbi:MAG: hypothetical protein RBR59_03635 [Sulfurimonadaceae bacterium]|jgi:hypothetical protein|nr:hypothetical protein [Sulfurimonadaceae bacterium]
MQKILKWFAPILTIGVAVFIIFFLVSINTHEKINESQPLVLQETILEQNPKQTWLDNFSQTEKLGYFYPVNEVYIQVDLKEKIIKETTYKLSASLLDPYQVFCLKEELKQHGLRYYLKRDSKKVELLIFSTDKAKLSALVNVLKNYQISAQIVPYKEDV